jgi:hypothetical protein
MFRLNDDNSIYATRGDIVFFSVSAEDDGKPYKFQAGDVVRIKVYGKKDAENVVLQKDFPVFEVTENVEIFLTEEDTKIGEVISKPKDYWYEVELNPGENPQTIIGYDEDGAKVFKLLPEGDDIPEWTPVPEDIPVVDDKLDITSPRPVANKAVARAFARLEDGYERTHAAVAELYVTPEMVGAIGDGEADDTEAIQAALDTKSKVLFKNGVYKVTRSLTAYNSVSFEKDAYIEFYPEADSDTCMYVCGSVTKLAENISCSVKGARMTVDMSSLGSLRAGDYVYIHNDETASPHGRAFDTKRDILQVHSVEAGAINFTSAPVYSYSVVSIDKMNTLDNIVVDGAKIKCMGDKAGTFGIALEYAKNSTIRNCHVSGFDYSQINIDYCVFCDAHSNFCEVDYTESLQYGIVVHSSANIAVYGNKVNSRRTAIDVTRLSNKVTVSGNTVVGNINTHSCTYTSITNNTINDGMILIRGKNTIVSGNTVENHELYCLDIEEMGIEGGHIITNNIFKGYCSMKCYLSNISITNNHFIVENVMTYGDDEAASVIRICGTEAPEKTAGAVISGNTFEAVGITPKYCIDANTRTDTIHNLVIQDNVIRGFWTGLYLTQKGQTPGDNLVVKNNMMFVTYAGIAFCLVNNTQIVGNTIIGAESGFCGIHRPYTESGDTVGLVIRDNFVKSFTYGVRIWSGAKMNGAVFMDNIYQDCDTNSNGITDNTTRVANELFASSITGKVFYLRLTDDGVLTPTLKDY